MASLAPATELPPAADRSADDAAYYRGVLHELIDMGADLARLVHRQVIARADAAEAGGGAGHSVVDEPFIAFERIVRTVRRTVLLAKRLDEVPVVKGVVTGVARAAARRRIIRAVEDTIQRSAEEDEAERLESEFMDRLDAPDIEDEIGSRPVQEIIDDICRDLGLMDYPGAHPWKRRTPEEVAALCRRATGREKRRGWNTPDDSGRDGAWEVPCPARARGG